MQKILLGLLSFLFAGIAYSQTVDDIKDLIQKQQWDKAKTTVDAFLLKDKNATKWEGWWYKGYIYNELSKSDQFKNLVPDGRMEAFNAFKKYYELDPKAILATLEQHVRLFDIYSGYFDLAAAKFNEKKFDSAFLNFKNAYLLETYIASKGFEYNNFKFPVFDTVLIQNIALSAYMSKNEDSAVNYYNIIIDQKISGKEYVDVYQFMVEYYNKKKDMINREKYLKLGRELYPKDDFWYLSELADANDKDKKLLFTKYEEVGAKYPDKYILFYNYAVELFNYAYTSEVNPADYKDIQQKIEWAAKKSLEINPAYIDPNVILAMHYYNKAYDLQEEINKIKGITEADKKKKADGKAQVMVIVDELIQYALTAHNGFSAKTTLKANEKANYKKVTDYLTYGYEIKGLKDKAEEYKKKLEAIH